MKVFKEILKKEIAERVTLSENDVLTILQNAHTVPLGCPIWETEAELEKYRKVIKSTINWMAR